jgi:hypothetical protein
MYREHKVVFSVFAGRRDRVELLLKNVDRFVKDGLVDEVHLWDFCRKEVDREWLRSLPLSVLVTGDEYLYSGQTEVHEATTYAFNVRGVSNDLSVLLTSPEGVEYELVLGGWDNTNSVFRKGKQTAALASNDQIRLDASMTPNAISLAWGEGVLSVTVNDSTVWNIPFEDSVKTIAHSTGWGNAGVYDFPVPTGPYKYCKPTSQWHSYYEHYATYKDSLYAQTLLIKADDDIVHMGSVAQFKAFLDFRVDHPEYSLVFPNIINNAAAAYYQKKKGLLDTIDGLEETMPAIGGKLWESASRARQLHELYLANPGAFVYEGYETIPPKHRVSINFFAVLPSLFETFPQAGGDDEHYLTVVHPGEKALFTGFAVSHLSFHSQDAEIGTAELLERYKSLEHVVVVTEEPPLETPVTTPPVEVVVAPKKRGRKKKETVII